MEVTREEFEQLKRDLETLRTTIEELIQFGTEVSRTVGNQFDLMVEEFKGIDQRVKQLELSKDRRQ